MNNSSKKLTEAITLVDRISNLPDELLCHILSFLQTKQAVTTSILSKRWQFVWTYVDTLVLSNFDPNAHTFSTKEEYMQFVRKVLELHRATLTKRMEITILRLSRTEDERDYVTWIQTVLFSKKVESLYLCFFSLPSHKWRLCLFSSNTLVELLLHQVDITNIMESPTAPFFPNLKKLDLHDVKVNTDSINRFISGCSILEDFCLCFEGGYFFWDACCISSDTLKKLDIYSNVSISLNTPALEVLGIFENRRLKELLVESSMPSLHEIHISMKLSELGLLKTFSNALVLSLEVVEFQEFFKFDLPAHFRNLTKLEIIAPWDYLGLLILFMENSNNLQVITLEKATHYVNGLIWEEPQQVPMCLLSSLRTICIKEYGIEEEIDLVIKYVLENAKVLEHMEIHPLKYYPEYNEINFRIQKISKFRRASEICELSFL